jgi:hypothetical protein
MDVSRDVVRWCCGSVSRGEVAVAVSYRDRRRDGEVDDDGEGEGG